MPFKRTRDLINFNAGIVHSHCRHWLQHCISLIHHLQIGITQNVIWWLPGWNRNLLFFLNPLLPKPKFSKLKWFLTLRPNQDMHFKGKILLISGCIIIGWAQNVQSWTQKYWKMVQSIAILRAYPNILKNVRFSQKKSTNRNPFFKTILKIVCGIWWFALGLKSWGE